MASWTMGFTSALNMGLRSYRIHESPKKSRRRSMPAMRPSRMSPTFAPRRPPGPNDSSTTSEAAADTFNPSALRVLTRSSNSVSCSVNFFEFCKELRVAWNFSGGRDDLREGRSEARAVARSGGGGGPQPDYLSRLDIHICPTHRALKICGGIERKGK